MRQLGRRPVRVRAELPGHVVNRLQAALWREAYDLVGRGAISVADLDEAVASGPGLRWALLGPIATQHLSGGPGRAWPTCWSTSVRPWSTGGPTSAPRRSTPELVDMLVDGRPATSSAAARAPSSPPGTAALQEILATKERLGYGRSDGPTPGRRRDEGQRARIVDPAPGPDDARPRPPSSRTGSATTYAELRPRHDPAGARAAGARGRARRPGRVPGAELGRAGRAMFATAQLGAVFVPLNTRLAPPELAYILGDSGARLLLVEDGLRRTRAVGHGRRDRGRCSGSPGRPGPRAGSADGSTTMSRSTSRSSSTTCS